MAKKRRIRVWIKLWDRGRLVFNKTRYKLTSEKLISVIGNRVWNKGEILVRYGKRHSNSASFIDMDGLLHYFDVFTENFTTENLIND